MRAAHLVLTLMTAFGCQMIAGITDRSEGSEPSSDGGSSGGSGPGGGGRAAMSGGAPSSSGGQSAGGVSTGGAGTGGVGTGGVGTGGAPGLPDAQPCILNSDCDGALVCIFATCSVPCRADGDCSPGSRCLDAVAGSACIDIGAATCDRSCPAGTACVDGVCRTPCRVDAGDSGSDSEAGPVPDASPGCRSDQRCVNGGCVGTAEAPPDGGSPEGGADGATPECSLGGRQCAGKVPQTCGADLTWQNGTACTHVCDVGVCTGNCDPGTMGCNGLAPRTCGSSGQWQDGAPCSFLCTAGRCTGDCTPGTRECDGDNARTCDAAGAWTTTVCPSTCSAGACAARCTTNAKQCSGLIPQTCDAQGNWVDGTACPFVCSAGTCTGTCTPGTTRCAGAGSLTPQTCSAQGSWASGTACPYLCNAGACTGVCVPGTVRCNGNTPQTCSASAQWVSGTACNPATSQCDAVTSTCKKLDGQACAARAECSSNFCADGRCCDTACTGVCQSCGADSLGGACSAVRNTTDADTCAGASQCNGNGQCELADGQECVIASDCANANCTTFYVDADYDGFGSTTTRRFCTTQAPMGYRTNNLDCCDSDPSAYPNSTAGNTFGGTPGWQPVASSCGSFDYNCDGQIQQTNGGLYPPCPSPAITCTTSCVANPVCGQSALEYNYNGFTCLASTYNWLVWCK